MAKTAKYSDELLTEAVVRYAEQYKGKIKASELAVWASANIEGLSGVQGYHFQRSVRYTDPKTGKTKEQKKQCTIKIEEINSSRSVAVGMKKNPLLQSSNIDDFLSTPAHVQRQYVMDTREQVETLQKRIIALERENQALRGENDHLRSVSEQLDLALQDCREAYTTLCKQNKWIIQTVDADQQKKAMAAMGIDDGIDFRKFREARVETMENAFKLQDALRKEMELENLEEAQDVAEQEPLSEMLLGGIDFGG